MRLAVVAMALVVAVGCKKKDEDKPANKTPPAKTDPAAAKKTPPAKTDPAAAKADPAAAKADPAAAKADPAAAKADPAAAKAEPAADAVKPLFDYKIAAKPMPYKPNEFVWASYPLNKTGTWGYNKVRFKAAKGDWAEVATLATFVTHSAFLHKGEAPDPKKLKKGTPVRAHVGIGVKYGRVDSVSGDKVKVKFYVSGPKSGERELPLTSVELWTKPALDPGTPVIYKDGDLRKLATLMHVEGDKAYIAGPKGLVEMDTKALTPVDPSKVYKKGQTVWAYARKGAFGAYKMTKGKITKVHDNGVWYEWKASEGLQLAKVSFAKVIRK